ncbi:class I SAM-dependent methyltransferase [Metaclostridioides mangenotii]|uniref:class I SAM-dependent methyltransferase n=1 Tax=Metaclostridioides mangenotii TaxID=1540 RepID=UPI000467E949|nr:class I SAM-dependent methyltransferase [Clostridioides mangenotii]
MNLFDNIAKKYDIDSRIELANTITKELRKELKNTSDKQALDYGCGTGLVGLQLTDKFRSILFVDSSEEMINVVNQKIEKIKVNNGSTMVGDFSTEDLPDVKVDFIIVSLVLLHVQKTSILFESLYKLLNLEGELIIVDFDKNEKINHEKVHNGFTHQELYNQAERVGFKDISVRTFYRGKEIFMNQDASMFIFNAKK